MNEHWKDITGYNEYQISNYGNIRKGDKLKKGSITSRGYLSVHLKGKNCKVHRLVAEHFILNPLNKPQVNHIDSNKLNNHVSNLEWVTASENVKHSYSNGRVSNGSSKRLLLNLETGIYYNSINEAMESKGKKHFNFYSKKHTDFIAI
jgi:hypothetical protein